MNLTTEICNSFNAHAADYEKAAKIQYEIGERLFERLAYLMIKPRYILDLGCGTGIFSARLKKLYPEAVIISFDLAYAMLQQTKNKQGWLKKWPLVNGDMLNMPFSPGVFDLVFANQVVHWSDSLARIFGEISRVMNINGCLMFSTLGPDTFLELKRAWALVDDYQHTNTFTDMHDIGDVLMAEHFLDPVVDMEYLSVHYGSISQLLQSLKAQGVRNINRERKRGLVAKNTWHAFERHLAGFKTELGKYPLTYEVVYGHAWKGLQQRVEGGVETRIPVAKLLKR
ncbi:MAG: malonyl-ACP O-methyltransferase BioC [Legionella sp.]